MTIECAFFGTLGRDAEAKTSKASGKPYVRLNVRCGEGDEAQWVAVLSFDEKAMEHQVAGKLLKGARVYVEGKLSPDQWTDKDGKERHGLSCVSWHTRLSQIGRARTRREKGSAASASDGNDGSAAVPHSTAGRRELDDEIPF